MDKLLEQLKIAADNELYYLCLAVVFILPDICGALGSNGEGDCNKYKKWFDDYVSPKYSNEITGEMFWNYRNGFSHNGRSFHEKNIKQLSRKRLIFQASTINSNLQFMPGKILKTPEGDTMIDIGQLAYAMIEGVNNWIEKVRGTEPFVSNYEMFLKEYSFGFLGIYGVPVVG